MAYEPALTSFILAGMVGGLALIMSLSADWEVTHELARATHSWTAVMVARTYSDTDSAARRRASKEAAILLAHGYEPIPQLPDSGPTDPDRASEADGPGGGPGVVSRDKVTVRYRLV